LTCVLRVCQLCRCSCPDEMRLVMTEAPGDWIQEYQASSEDSCLNQTVLDWTRPDLVIWGHIKKSISSGDSCLNLTRLHGLDQTRPGDLKTKEEYQKPVRDDWQLLCKSDQMRADSQPVDLIDRVLKTEFVQGLRKHSEEFVQDGTRLPKLHDSRTCYIRTVQIHKFRKKSACASLSYDIVDDLENGTVAGGRTSLREFCRQVSTCVQEDGEVSGNRELNVPSVLENAERLWREYSPAYKRCRAVVKPGKLPDGRRNIRRTRLPEDNENTYRKRLRETRGTEAANNEERAVEDRHIDQL
ncbi:hypothetical protein Bbelb_210100, partial [Branchiostoma belcheri]